MCFTLSSPRGRSFTDYYPGSSVIDMVAFDCYNQIWAKGQYIAPATQFAAVLAVSQSIGKPFAITEFGSQLAAGDPSGVGRAAWLEESASYLPQQGAVFVTYFDSPVDNEYRLMDATSLPPGRPSSEQRRAGASTGPGPHLSRVRARGASARVPCGQHHTCERCRAPIAQGAG